MFSRFWTSVLFFFRVGRASEVRFVEQMNKKVDLSRLKKLPTVRVGLGFYLNAPTNNAKLKRCAVKLNFIHEKEMELEFCIFIQ